jgi:hypothetical protein
MVGKTEKKTTMQQKTDVTTATVNVVNHLLKLIRNGYLRYRTEVKKSLSYEMIRYCLLLNLRSAHRYRKAKNRLLKCCYVPATSAAQNRLLFYFFAAAVYSTTKQTRQALSSL